MCADFGLPVKWTTDETISGRRTSSVEATETNRATERALASAEKREQQKILWLAAERRFSLHQERTGEGELATCISRPTRDSAKEGMTGEEKQCQRGAGGGGDGKNGESIAQSQQ